MIVPVCLAEPPCNTAMAQSVFGMCPAAPFAAGGLYFTSLVGGSTAPVIISFSPTRGDGYTLGWQGGFLGLPRAHGAVWYQFLIFQTSIYWTISYQSPTFMQSFHDLGHFGFLFWIQGKGWLILCLSCPPRQGRLQETWIEMGQGPWVHS